MRRFAWWFAFLALLGCGAGPDSPAIPPHVSATVTGPKEIVFDTQDGCEQIDIPDAPARAFRDDRLMVHLIATHYVARAMTGPDLNHLRHDCRVIYRSPKDPDPSNFQDNNWLYSFFTSDGRHIAALVHSEYDAEEIPGMCATPDDTGNCWWNTVTFAQSFDGGNSFTVPPPPHNLVAALPWPYVVGNREGARGYHWPTNILRLGGFYYALINVWPYRAQQFGACLVRTSDVFDPGSWRAWDGKDFTIRFADPYRERIARPEEHICPVVLAGAAENLVQHAGSGAFLVLQFATDAFGPAGFYIQASRDLRHWSDPALVVTVGELLAAEGPGKWSYEYLSLLDPASADRNFATVSDEPYLYYVRSDGLHPPYVRALCRRKIRLRFGAKPGGL